MNKISELNNKRNEAMDEIIEIDDELMPKLMKRKREIAGNISIVTKRKNMLWMKIKGLHKEIKNDKTS